MNGLIFRQIPIFFLLLTAHVVAGETIKIDATIKDVQKRGLVASLEGGGKLSMPQTILRVRTPVRFQDKLLYVLHGSKLLSDTKWKKGNRITFEISKITLSNPLLNYSDISEIHIQKLSGNNRD